MPARQTVDATTGRASGATGWFFGAAAIGPGLWLMGFSVLVLRARQVAGHWPRPYEPDPGEAGWWLYVVLAGTLPLIYTCGVIYLVALVVGLCIPSVRLTLREAGLKNWHVYGAGLTLAALMTLLRTNPHQLMTWLAD